ncbi:hypothetical protein EYC80_002916 [Monilinia laxa]|uniref:2EXR domain-containing protein n=1 Tax=Monilinia laxa TaxID=61186 RepID=A0A5N6KDA2_MONLA|nr:hypothetical protein EYC80_002916 [Monilinia laxa]
MGAEHSQHMAGVIRPDTTKDGDNMDRNGSGTRRDNGGVNATKAVESESSDAMNIDQPGTPYGKNSPRLEEEDDLYGASPLRAKLLNLHITSVMTSTETTPTRSTAQQNPQNKTFYRFRELGPEVRCMVWKYYAEAEENFSKPRVLTVISKYTGENTKNDKRHTYVSELRQRMNLRDDSRTRSFDENETFPWVTQPASSFKMPASMYINRESKKVSGELYSKSHLLMSIFGNGKPVYFREDLDVLHFADWFTFNTFCLQFAFVQTKKTFIAGAIQAMRRREIPLGEEDLPLNLRCLTCQKYDKSWNPSNPCGICQDLNPRERLDDHIKHVAIGTESFGLVERYIAERCAVSQIQTMRVLRERALKYMNWGFNRLYTLVLGMEGHPITTGTHSIGGIWVDDRSQTKEDVLNYFSMMYFRKIGFLPKKEFEERFGVWDPKYEIA